MIKPQHLSPEVLGYDPCTKCGYEVCRCPAARTTPAECRRALACQPLHAIVANDESSFVCSGMPEDHVPGDEIRLCFVTPSTDTMYDHDENDLLDMIEVISRGMSTKRRLEA